MFAYYQVRHAEQVQFKCMINILFFVDFMYVAAYLCMFEIYAKESVLLIGAASNYFTNSLLNFFMQDMDKGKKLRKGYVAWNDDMDKVLLDTFVEFYNKGYKIKIVGRIMSTLLL